MMMLSRVGWMAALLIVVGVSVAMLGLTLGCESDRAAPSSVRRGASHGADVHAHQPLAGPLVATRARFNEDVP